MLPEILELPPGRRSRELIERLGALECPAFSRRRALRADLSGGAPSIVLERGQGSNVWDVDGNCYADFAAGFGSILCGHKSARFVDAVESQMQLIAQGLGDLYSSRPKVELLDRIARTLGGAMSSPRVLLCQSGADAVTAALKTAVLATGRAGIVAFGGSYHGLGYAPLAALDFKPSYREPFAEALNPHVRFVPFPFDEASREASLVALRAELARGDVGAVLIEPILGRGGVIAPPAGFLAAVADAARSAGAISIADEIWTGLGRSGSMVKSVDDGARFDVLCFGKGLGGGLSISAIVAPDEIMQAWARGGEVVHTSTHAGSPVACAAALATLDQIEGEGLVARARVVGERFSALLRERARGFDFVRDVRGAGLMIGVEHASGAIGLAVVGRLLERGFIATVGGRGAEVVVLTPPLNVPEELVDACVEAFVEVWETIA